MQRSRLVSAVFYGGLLVVLAAIVFKVLGNVLPHPLARPIGFNSESYTLLLLLAPWIQFVRPRLAGSKWEWPVTLAAAAACVVIGLLLYKSHLPSQWKTLNEAFFAGGLIAYLQLRRPLPPWVPIVISGGVLAMIVLASDNAIITGVAEALGVLILLPLAVDVFDRRILNPKAPRSPALQYGWWGFLVLAPVVFSVLNRTLDDGGALDQVARYGVRPQEAFVAVLLLGLYFAVLHSRQVRENAKA